MSKFKKCPNGHTYKADLPVCPHCARSRNGASNMGATATELITDLDNEEGMRTSTDTEPVFESAEQNIDPHQDFSRTMIEEEVEIEDEHGNLSTVVEQRAAKRLVGWLVTYDLDPYGVDFRIFEGRNIIGKDADCNICINDSKASAQHAILLYRNGKFRIKDNLSTNGTYVNGVDIDDDSMLITDGNIIKIGETELMFRTAFIEEP